MERVLTRLFASILLPLLTAAPVSAQAPLSPSTPPIVFSPGTGDGSPAPMVPIRPTLACAALPQTQAILAVPPSPHRLDQKLVNQALAAYAKHNCSYGRTSGPALIVVVDFAKKSSEPRLYRIDLRTGQGVDDPIRVAHGIGSDPNDDGVIDAFSDVQDSLMSSLGAARGGEIYVGINGLSLRLDGLEPTNRSMRARDIVVHSYSPALPRYFNAAVMMARGGRPGTSEGCFVVEPDKRDWIMQTLVDGGFLYAGYSGVLPSPKPLQTRYGQQVVFSRGTGVSPTVPRRPAPGGISEIPAGTPGTPPTAPIPPAPAEPQQ